MIDGIYYQSIFLLIVTLLTIECYFRYSTSNEEVYDSPVPGYILAILLGLFIGFRPVHRAFADTVGYAVYHDSHLGSEFHFKWDTENILFDNWGNWLASINLDHSIFFVSVALLYFVIRYFSCRVLFPDNSWIAYLFFLGAFMTFTSSVNGIKAGVASSFFALAIGYRNNWIKALICLIIAYCFHHAFHVCIICYIVVYLYDNTKMYLIIWILALLLAIFHISYFQELFSGFTDEKGAAYLSIGTGGWRTGMRYDFVLYSVIPIIVGWIVMNKYGFEDKIYSFALNCYILSNAIWLLCMYASFTNRIAALSWALYPIVISYPFLSDKLEMLQSLKNRYVSVSLILNLGFTLFMTVIYYGILKTT